MTVGAVALGFEGEVQQVLVERMVDQHRTVTPLGHDLASHATTSALHLSLLQSWAPSVWLMHHRRPLRTSSAVAVAVAQGDLGSVAVVAGGVAAAAVAAALGCGVEGGGYTGVVNHPDDVRWGWNTRVVWAAQPLRVHGDGTAAAGSPENGSVGIGAAAGIVVGDLEDRDIGAPAVGHVPGPKPGG